MYLNTFDDEFIPLIKDVLRKQMRKRKRALTTEEKLADEKEVFDTIDGLKLLEGAHHVMLYYSLPDELPTHATVEQWAKRPDMKIYLPRVKGDDIEVVPYTGPDSLSDDNPFHIAEPVGEAVDPAALDAVIVPGVAFDRHANRMGRGRGYYDRLLTQGNLYTIGVCHDCQILDHIPCEPHDRPLDCVISPTTFLLGRKFSDKY